MYYSRNSGLEMGSCPKIINICLVIFSLGPNLSLHFRKSVVEDNALFTQLMKIKYSPVSISASLDGISFNITAADLTQLDSMDVAQIG